MTESHETLQGRTTTDPWWRDRLVVTILAVFAGLALVVAGLFFSSYRYSKHELAIRTAEQQGELENAVDDLKALIDMLPEESRTNWRVKLGRVYLEREEYEAALDQFTLVKQQAPHKQLDREMMIALFETGRIEEGQAAMQRVLERMPQDPAAHYYFGVLLMENGQPREASRHFRISAVEDEWDQRADPYRVKIAEAIFMTPPTLPVNAE